MAKRRNSNLSADAKQAVKDARAAAKFAKKQAVKDARAAAKFAKKQAQDIARAQIKEMRPYMRKLKNIDLRKEITPQARSFVTKAWREYQELTTRPFKVYRTKNNKRLKQAQAYSRHEAGKPNFDVAFVPTADPKAKIKFTKDGIKIKSKYVTETVLFFDIKNLAIDPVGEIRRTLAKNPDAKQFIIMAGKYLYNGGLARSLVEGKIQNLMLQYSPGGAMYEKRGPNAHFENWLFGLVAFEAHKQVSIDEYRTAYAKSVRGIKKAKNSARRKRQRQYGEKF